AARVGPTAGGESPAGLFSWSRGGAAQDRGTCFKRCTIPSSDSEHGDGYSARPHFSVAGASVKRASLSWQEAHPSTCCARRSRSAVVNASANRSVSVATVGQESTPWLRGRCGGDRSSDHEPASSLWISSWSIFCTLLLAT